MTDFNDLLNSLPNSQPSDANNQSNQFAITEATLNNTQPQVQQQASVEQPPILQQDNSLNAVIGALPDTQASSLSKLYNIGKLDSSKYAENKQISEQTGLSTQTVQSDIVLAKQKANEPNWDDLVKVAPNTTKQLASDTDFFNLAHDDTKSLSLIEQITNGFKSGQLSTQAAQLALNNQLQKGFALRKQAEDLSKDTGTLGEIANFIGSMVEASPTVINSTRGGLAAGAAIGAGAGAVLPLTEPLTLAGGATLGGITGFQYGLFKAFHEMSAGNALLDLKQQGVPDNIAVPTSNIIGILGGALSLVNGELVTAPFAKGFQKLITDKVASEVLNKPGGKAVTNFLTEYSKGTASNAAVMALNSGIADTAETVAKDLSGQTVNYDDLKTRVLDETIHSIKIASILALPGATFHAGASYYKDLQDSKTNVLAQQQLDQSADNSKLKVNDPIKFKDFVNNQAQGTPIETVAIGASDILEAVKNDPTITQNDIPKIILDRLDDNNDTGTKVEIPQGDWQLIKDTKFGEAIKDKVEPSTNPVLKTEDLKDIVTENKPSQIPEVTAEEIQHPEQDVATTPSIDAAHAVYTTVLDDLNTKSPENEIKNEEYSKLIASHYYDKAEELQSDAKTLYDTNPLVIDKVLVDKLIEETPTELPKEIQKAIDEKVNPQEIPSVIENIKSPEEIKPSVVEEPIKLTEETTQTEPVTPIEEPVTPIEEPIKPLEELTPPIEEPITSPVIEPVSAKEPSIETQTPTENKPITKEEVTPPISEKETFNTTIPDKFNIYRRLRGEINSVIESSLTNPKGDYYETSIYNSYTNAIKKLIKDLNLSSKQISDFIEYFDLNFPLKLSEEFLKKLEATETKTIKRFETPVLDEEGGITYEERPISLVNLKKASPIIQKEVKNFISKNKTRIDNFIANIDKLPSIKNGVSVQSLVGDLKKGLGLSEQTAAQMEERLNSKTKAIEETNKNLEDFKKQSPLKEEVVKKAIAPVEKKGNVSENSSDEKLKSSKQPTLKEEPISNKKGNIITADTIKKIGSLLFDKQYKFSLPFHDINEPVNIMNFKDSLLDQIKIPEELKNSGKENDIGKYYLKHLPPKTEIKKLFRDYKNKITSSSFNNDSINHIDTTPIVENSFEKSLKRATSQYHARIGYSQNSNLNIQFLRDLYEGVAKELNTTPLEIFKSHPLTLKDISELVHPIGGKIDEQSEINFKNKLISDYSNPSELGHPETNIIEKLKTLVKNEDEYSKYKKIINDAYVHIINEKTGRSGRNINPYIRAFSSFMYEKYPIEFETLKDLKKEKIIEQLLRKTKGPKDDLIIEFQNYRNHLEDTSGQELGHPETNVDSQPPKSELEKRISKSITAPPEMTPGRAFVYKLSKFYDDRIADNVFRTYIKNIIDSKHLNMPVDKYIQDRKNEALYIGLLVDNFYSTMSKRLGITWQELHTIAPLDFDIFLNRELYTKEGLSQASYNPSNKRISINKFIPYKIPEMTTHELGHFFLDTLENLTKSLDADHPVSKMFVDALDWFGIKGDNTKAKGDAWSKLSQEQKTRFHEKFAATWQYFTATGKAPIERLKPLFRMFTEFFKQAYNSVKQFLNQHPHLEGMVKYDTKIESVFNRLLVLDEAKDAIPKAFEDANAANMTEKEFHDYQNLSDTSTQNEGVLYLETHDPNSEDIRLLQEYENSEKELLITERFNKIESLEQDIEDIHNELLQTDDNRIIEKIHSKLEEKQGELDVLYGEQNKDIYYLKTRRDEYKKEKQNLEVNLKTLNPKSSEYKLTKKSINNFSKKIKDFNNKILFEETNKVTPDLPNFIERLKNKQFATELRQELEARETKIRADIKNKMKNDPNNSLYNRIKKGELSDEQKNTVLGKLIGNKEAFILFDKNTTGDLKTYGRLKNKKLTSDKGIDADTLALLNGFGTKEELFSALLNRKSYQQLRKEYYDNYGKPIPKVELIDIDQINKDKEKFKARVEQIKTEHEKLTELSGNTRASSSLNKADAIVNKLYDTLTIKDLLGNKYKAAAKAYAFKAWLAAKKGDYNRATNFKQKEYINQLISSKSVENPRLERPLRKTVKLLTKLSKISVIDYAKTYNGDLVTVAQLLVNGDITHAKINLENIKNYDHILYADLKSIIDSDPFAGKDWKTLTYNEFKAHTDIIKTIWHLAKQSKSIEINNKRQEIVLVGNELKSSAETVNPDINNIPPQNKPIYKDPSRRLGLAWLSSKASTMRMERLIKILDGDNSQGVFRKFIFTPIRKSIDRMELENREYGTKFFEIVKELYDEKLISGEEIYNKELDYTFKGHNEILAMLSHIGNESNLKKLVLGHGWGIDHPLGLDIVKFNKGIKEFIDNGIVKKEHVDAVQKVWDLIGAKTDKAGKKIGLLADAQKAYKKMYGVFFKEVPLKEFTLTFKDGETKTYKGGYVPCVIDRDKIVDKPIDEKSLEDIVYKDHQFMLPGVIKSFTKQRTEVYRPLELNFRLLTSHIDKVLRFVHVENEIKQAYRLIQRPEVKNSILKINPYAIRDTVIPFFERAARQSTSIIPETAFGHVLNTIADHFKRNAIASKLIGNITNILTNLTGIFVPMNKWLYRNPNDIPVSIYNMVYHGITNATESEKLINSMSDFMKNRSAIEYSDKNAINFKQRLEEILEPNTGVLKYTGINYTKRANTVLEEFSGKYLQGAFQRIVDRAVWMTEFDRLKGSMPEEDVVNACDSLVRESQSTRQVIDHSRAQFGNVWNKMFNFFANYQDSLRNYIFGNYDIDKNKNGNLVALSKLTTAIMIGVIIPNSIIAVSHGLIYGQSKKRAKDNDGGFNDYVEKFGVYPGVQSITSMIPYGIGSIANTGIDVLLGSSSNNARVISSPALDTAGASIKLLKYMHDKAVKDNANFTEDDQRSMAKVLGALSGLPTEPGLNAYNAFLTDKNTRDLGRQVP